MDIIDAIKDKLPLATWLEGRITLKRQGRTLVGVCPFHVEKTGSFVVWPDEDRFHCFGCGASGDIFSFYQQEAKCEFKDALKELAKQAGVELRHKPEDLASQEKARARGRLLGEAVEHYRQHLGEQHRAYLRKRGFTDEFIDAHRFGWAPGNTIGKALAHYGALLQEVGLVNHEGRDFFWNRLIIPVYGRDGEIANLVGRVWEKDKEPKYLRLPGAAGLINEQALRKAETVYLCEGEIDTLTLCQCGLPAVGVGGASGLQNGAVERFRHAKTIYVCADADTAGKGLVLRAGEMLGNRCRIVELPAGEDVNSWVGQGNDLAALAETARPFLDYLIECLPSEIEPQQMDCTLEPVLRALSQVGKASQDAYSKKLSKKTGVSVATVKEALREMVTMAEPDTKAHGDGSLIWRDVYSINPAQDYYNGTMYTVAFIDGITVDPETGARELSTQPYVVTSKREMFPLVQSEIYSRGLRITPTKIPTFSVVGRRWSTSEEGPYSVKAYLDNGATVSPWEVYTEVVTYFRQFIDYSNDWYYDFLALWTIGTYFYNLYQAYPYVHLTGSKRVGKSLTQQVVEQLAFNALFSSSMSAAAAFRAVESCSTTLLIDEAENLQKKSKDDNRKDDDKIEILKSGYMKGPKAIRCAGDNHDVVSFDVYSPKMFGSIHALDKILADRAITLILTRKRRQLPELNFSEMKAQMAATRDKLYVLMLSHASDLQEIIKIGIGWDGVKDRERQLWTPILTLAGFFDQYQFDESEGVMPENLLIVKMRRLATLLGEAKLAKEQSEQTELLILEGIIDYLKTAMPVERDFYPTTAILEHLQQIEELGWLRDGRQIIRELERVGVIQNKQRDTARIRWQGKQSRMVRLDSAKLQEVAQRYGAAL